MTPQSVHTNSFRIYTLWLCGLCVSLYASTTLAETFVYKPYLTADSFYEHDKTWKEKSYRLIDVSGCRYKGQDEYFAIWEKKEGAPYVVEVNMTSSEYQSKFNSLKEKGYRLTHISGFAAGAQAKYAAIWEKKNGPTYVAKHGMTGTIFQQQANKWKRKGYRPIHVSAYSIKRAPRFAAIWEKSSGPLYVLSHGMSNDKFYSMRFQMTQKGYELKVASGYEQFGTERFAALWEKTNEPIHELSLRHSKRNFTSAFWNRYYSGYSPRQIDAFSINHGEKRTYLGIFRKRPEGVSKDIRLTMSTIVTTFLKKWDVAGVSVAITKDERLVFAQGYGFADKDQDPQWEVNPNQLFRIASVSKPITAIALIKLLETNKRHLDSKVFGETGILGFDYFDKNAMRSWKDKPKPPPNKPGNFSRGDPGDLVASITVRHLLGHGSGLDDGYDEYEPGWPYKLNGQKDVMFKSTWLDFPQAQLITEYFKFDEYFAPVIPAGIAGVYHNYSNFGYLLLGRVIEKLSGKPYQTYVKENLLTPIGIDNMFIGGELKSDRHPNEVTYYANEPNKSPYGVSMKVSRMDAHGGWVASPIDLLKLLVRADGSPNKPDILSKKSMKEMASGVPWNPGRGLGWMVNPDKTKKNFWIHSGAFKGSRAWLRNRSDDVNTAAVINTSAPDIEGKSLTSALRDEVLRPIVDLLSDNQAWPTYDLF